MRRYAEEPEFQEAVDGDTQLRADIERRVDAMSELFFQEEETAEREARVLDKQVGSRIRDGSGSVRRPHPTPSRLQRIKLRRILASRARQESPVRREPHASAAKGRGQAGPRNGSAAPAPRASGGDSGRPDDILVIEEAESVGTRRRGRVRSALAACAPDAPHRRRPPDTEDTLGSGSRGGHSGHDAGMPPPPGTPPTEAAGSKAASPLSGSPPKGIGPSKGSRRSPGSRGSGGSRSRRVKPLYAWERAEEGETLFDPYTPTLTRQSGSQGKGPTQDVPTVQGRHMAKARQAVNSAKWKEQRGVGA